MLNNVCGICGEKRRKEGQAGQFINNITSTMLVLV